MEPRRDQDYELSVPESLRPRGGPSTYSRAPYSQVSSIEDDPDFTDSRNPQRCTSPPVLPAVSEMTGLPAFGLGITDSRGQFPESPPTGHGHMRDTSNPFSDPEGTPKGRPQSDVRFPSFNTLGGSDVDSTGLRSPQTAVDTPKINLGPFRILHEHTIAQTNLWQRTGIM